MTSSYDPNDSKPIPTTHHSDHSARHTSSKGFGTKVVGPATTRSSLAERVGCGTRGVTRGSQHACCVRSFGRKSKWSARRTSGHDTHVCAEEVVEGRRNCSFATAGELSHCSIRNCFSPFVDEETDRQQANQHIFCWQFSAVKRWTTGAPGLLPVLSVSSRTWGMWGIRGFLATSSTDLEWSHS